jgi:uncharacterized surface protein with fasciclin (FAS1) repeats
MLTAAPVASGQSTERFVVAVSYTNTPDPAGDVIDVAAATGQFTYFLEAVEQTGFTETLRGEGPFTIFAPTDEAFRAMDARERTRLLAPENHDELLALLAYHVVDERVTTESANGRVVREEASNGYRVTIDGRDGLRVNDQLVTMPDITASNGVIQGINSVLAPPVMVASLH